MIRQIERQPIALVSALLMAVLAWSITTVDLSLLLPLTAAAGITFALIRRPWLAWVGLAAFLPFAGQLRVGRLSGIDILLAAAVGLWFADGVRRRALPLRASTPLLLAVLYALTLSVALFGASDLGEAAAEVVKWMEFAVVLLIVPGAFRLTSTHWLVLGLLAGATAQAVLGLYQFVFQIGPEWFVILGRFMRASGSFAQPNPFAGYLGLTLPVAISLAMWAWGTLLPTRTTQRRSASWWNMERIPGSPVRIGLTVIYSLTALVIGMALLASWSRGGWLGAVAGVGVVVALRNRATLILSGLLLLLLLAAFVFGSISPGLIPEPVMARVQDIPALIGSADVLSQPLTDENFSLVERVAHWAAALRMWEQDPWLGVGPGNYATVYPQVRLPIWEEPLGHAHNIYLNVLGESGLIGFTAFLALWIGVMAWTWQCFRPASGWWRAVALGVFGVLVHLAVHNLVDNLFVQGIYVHVALWLAALLTWQQREVRPERQLK